MDDRRFDDLTRRLATSSSRRSMLKGLIGGGTAVVAARKVSDLEAKSANVDVCHWDDDAGGYVWITISENGWLSGHLGQHDRDYLRAGGCCTNADCAAESSCSAGACSPIATTTTEAPVTTTEAPVTTTEAPTTTTEAPATTTEPPTTTTEEPTTTTTEEPTTTTTAIPDGTVGVGRPCVEDADCVSGQCGCNSPPGLPTCMCREELCLADGATCSGSAGAVVCCSGDCSRITDSSGTVIICTGSDGSPAPTSTTTPLPTTTTEAPTTTTAAPCAGATAALLNCGPGSHHSGVTYTCPTGATTFCLNGVLDPTSSAQAKAACEACYGVGECSEADGCGGAGWYADPYFSATFAYGPSTCVHYPGDPVTTAAGRVYIYSLPYPEYNYGYWGREDCPA